jgi:hypothetical protein
MAIWGNLLVLGVTVGVFVATLSLSRAALTKSQRSTSAGTTAGTTAGLGVDTGAKRHES